ncbi:hypothetical protein [uncultured Thiodictyon sp.]|uniref:hypothetical protein n=1 Tax=uncultured Thiodictyon sp. TaxID=1846217 RepID=UPI0025E13B64|nr:hypothetical protein [uncultured Thiodictyon sp.]
MLMFHANERQLVQQLLVVLQTLPGVHANVAPCEPAGAANDRGYDAEIDLSIAGKSLTLLVETRKTVYPRDVQQALWRIKSQANRSARPDLDSVPVLAAESLSPGAKDLLRTEQVGYFDSGGSLYLPAPGAYVYIDKPPPKAQATVMRSLFTGRRASAIHTLLMQREQWFGVKELAERSQVSPATASEILRELEKFDWIAIRGQGPNKERHLRDPRALLDAWAAQVAGSRPAILRRYFVPGTKAEALVDRAAQAFEAHGASYAISNEAAAQRYAPFLSSFGQVRCRVLVTPEATDALADLGARVVNEGANFAIIDVKSPGDLLFRERVGNAWLASPIHVYLDLLKGEGRAKEMAEHLRNERIGC